jgi:hypothetical protein
VPFEQCRRYLNGIPLDLTSSEAPSELEATGT